MAINEHATEFAGHPVADWDAEEGIQDPQGVTYRIELSYDEQEGESPWTEKFRQFFGAPKENQVIRWVDKFSLFLNDPNSQQTIGLVIGDWGLFCNVQDSTSVVEALVEARDRLPNLKALFLGDVIGEECEISWLEHCDISSIFSAYPQLEHFCVRGANKLSFGQLQHDHLKTLIVQSGGLPATIINEILAAQLPHLEHLELWLGTDYYGGDATVGDLQPLLSGNLFPNLTYLGLRDSEIADDIAKAVANAPILNRIKVLDLSMGTLSDEGAEALLASPLIPKLHKLDIHFHYCSEAVIQKFAHLRIAVNTSEPQEKHSYDNESWRYAQSASDPSFIIIAPPDSNRVTLFQQALARLRLAPARVVSYLDLLAGRITLPQIVRANSVLRIESPGKSFEVDKAFLKLGAEVEDTGIFARISAQEVGNLSFEKGRILWPRQWYLGFCKALRLIERQISNCAEIRLLNAPQEIALMFDKPRCHELLRNHQISVPRSLGTIRTFDELTERMKQMRCPRVFVKLAHGSSASGVVAYQTNGRQQQATTTVEMVRHQGELRLYNSRRLRTFRDGREIAALIDELCRHHVQVEQWLPKAGFQQKTFDLRVVVISGQARHVVARLSRNPITNLHLLNERSEVEAIKQRMGEAAWQAAMDTCERVARLFPNSFSAGIDLLITADYKRHAVLEVNAFGDLLPGVLWQGLDTYTAQIKALLEYQRVHCAATRN